MCLHTETASLSRLRTSKNGAVRRSRKEFPGVGRSKTVGFIRRLKQLQDDLGDLNDVRVARVIVASLADPNAPNTGIDHAGRRIIAWHKRRLARTEPTLKRRLRQLFKTKPFWIGPALSDDLDQEPLVLPARIWPDADVWRPLAIRLRDQRL